ncbi:hypothetical protein ABL78_0842 [Leptomonas seymouri]|uniref:Eukaryotic translation initiation factor 3 30 kDa subunit n=1 Tax=Leptomonas seymouri TaxID=5684 RepID=A0A0N1IMC3_LEPSE|nr:hypothetical protein ABL78_0842 [Leptomonas seymouri]|eukprot:KPI89982.1 hypothetical protein ABL78_0842 [Leptomonas seymouri]
MDDYYDDAEYDDYEYDDAADDWEAEAAEVEQKAKEEEIARKVRAEKKLVTRAPVKEEEVVPDDVEHAIADLRQIANDVASGSALLGDNSEVLIGNASIAEAEDVDRVGAMIAQRLISFSGSAHYDKLMADVFERLTKQMNNSALLTEEADRVHRLREELKRAAKAKPKLVEEKAPLQRKGLDLDNFEDRGGAYVAGENEDETGW